MNLREILAPARFIGADSRFMIPKPTIDLVPMPATRIRECAPLSFAMLDALAVGERAIFGRESFPSALSFFQACAHLLAMLPSHLRRHASFAAGFSRPIANVLIQWIDDRVLPSKPSILAAKLMRQGNDITVADVSRGFGELPILDDIIELLDNNSNERAVRSCFADILSSDAAPTDSCVCAWQTILSAMTKNQTAIPSTTMQAAASLVDGLFGSASASRSPRLFSRAGLQLLKLRHNCPLSISNSLLIEDGIEEIEQTLAASKWLAERFGWTPSLDALSKAAIASLRRIMLERSDTDCGINASLVRAIARAPHCRRVVARLIGLGDRAVVDALAQACTIAEECSRRLRWTRDRLAHEVFLIRSRRSSGPESTLHELRLANARLTFSADEDHAFAS
jgi:hypothetical protein